MLMRIAGQSVYITNQSRRNAANMKLDVHTGQVFGRWTIVDEVITDVRGKGRPRRRFQCKCSCGVLGEVNLSALVGSTSRSCGCYRAESSASRSLKHGNCNREGKTAEYNSWYAMHVRCSPNPNSRQYSLYYGRGIRICERWMSAENFLADMGKKPGLEYSLDRIDNDGNYELSNCRWATPKEQARNRTNNHMIEICGVVKPLAVWCEEYGIKQHIAGTRIRRGWRKVDAITLPSGSKNPK